MSQKQPDIAAHATVKPANKRGAARLAAVQALYQMELSGASVTEIVAEYENSRLGQEIDGETYLDADHGWFRSVVSGVVSQQRRIDPEIHSMLTPDWPLARLHTLLRSILRAAVYELVNRKEVPARVIISEYVDVAKAFFSDDEPGMINGVLDRITRKLRAEELPARAAESRGTGGAAPDGKPD
ncbi:MAG: transcription antitermination factor NusB [Nitratireductor sp.]|nr:transcription antitermination factor NusB [Nitratireductor sp.]